MRSIYLIGTLLGVSLLSSDGAGPVLTHLHPAGVTPGATTTVKLSGKFDPWPCQVWTAVPGIVFTAGKEAGSFDVTVAPEVPAGPCLIRAFNGEDVSAPIAMVVDRAAQTLDAEPNDDFRTPQELSVATAIINGKHEKGGDVDSFAVNLKQGQVMVAWVEAYLLAAGFDAMLRIVNPQGGTLAFNHDHTTMDPFLIFTAPEDGRYIVQTMGHKYPASSDINFAGGDDCVYRLHLSTGPVVRNTWPLAVQRGEKRSVMLDGWNLTAPTAELEESAPPAYPVTFSDVPEVVETTELQTLIVPSAVSGRIEAAGREDRYQFTATKDARLELSVTGPRYGSEIDAWLKVRDPEGKELATNDDEGGSTEARLSWTVPADGTYTAAVGDLTQRGGRDFYYRLLITPAVPAVSAAIAGHSAKVEAGKAAELKVAVTLTNGFASKLKLAAKNLPAGVTAEEKDVPEKGGEVVLSLTAAASAPVASQPFQLVLRETGGGKEYPVEFSMISVSENNGVPQGYRELLINSTDKLWLTIAAPPPPPPAPPAEPVPAAK
ncbi:MAG: PPC domain-containing protein [Verrucomicrobiota bacterium]